MCDKKGKRHWRVIRRAPASCLLVVDAFFGLAWFSLFDCGQYETCWSQDCGWFVRQMVLRKLKKIFIFFAWWIFLELDYKLVIDFLQLQSMFETEVKTSFSRASNKQAESTTLRSSFLLLAIKWQEIFLRERRKWEKHFPVLSAASYLYRM